MIHHQGHTFTRDEVGKRVAEVAAVWREGGEIRLADGLTRCAIEFLRTGRVHPTDDLQAQADLIAIAERDALIGWIGDWVVFEDEQMWQELPEIARDRLKRDD